MRRQTNTGESVSLRGCPILKVWDLVDGRNIATFTGDDWLFSCAVLKDGKTLVAGSASGEVHFLELEELEEKEEKSLPVQN
ncbi:MAG: hypothetical protein GY765_04940 [bacterium]|nr:hypothetical protein [bacterium]